VTVCTHHDDHRDARLHSEVNRYDLEEVVQREHVVGSALVTPTGLLDLLLGDAEEDRQKVATELLAELHQARHGAVVLGACVVPVARGTRQAS